MLAIIPSSYHQKIYLWSLMLLAASLALAPFFVTLSQIFLFANWLLEGNFKEKFKRIWSNKAAVALLSIYLLHLLGLFYTVNFVDAAKDLRIKLPLLLIILVSSSISCFSKKDIDKIVISLLGSLFLASLISIGILMGLTGLEVNYTTYSGSRIQALSPMISHIRYSLLMCVGVFMSAYYYITSVSKNKWLYGFLCIWLIAFLALLGVRSGILSFFSVLILISGYYLIQPKRIWLGLTLLALLISLPFVFYHLVPAFKLGIDEVKWEINYYNQGGNPSGHSIPQRFVYWKVAHSLIAEQPILGVGTGDFKDAYINYYSKNPKLLEKKAQLRAHNQYLTMVVTFGFIGLSIFLLGVFYPLIWYKRQLNLWYIGFFITFIVSMLIEDTLETQAGATFFAFFSGLFILQQNAKEVED